MFDTYITISPIVHIYILRIVFSQSATERTGSKVCSAQDAIVPQGPRSAKFRERSVAASFLYWIVEYCGANTAQRVLRLGYGILGLPFPSLRLSINCIYCNASRWPGVVDYC